MINHVPRCRLWLLSVRVSHETTRQTHIGHCFVLVMSDSLSSDAVQPGTFKIDPLSERWIDLRLVSASRLLLAGAGLLVTLVDTEVGSKYIPLITTLALYTVYSAIVLLLSVRRNHVVPVQYLHWFDMIWFVVKFQVTDSRYQ